MNKDGGGIGEFIYFVFLAELLLFDKNRPLFQQFSKITSGLERVFSSLQAATDCRFVAQLV